MNMSHCALQNTSEDLYQVIELIESISLSDSYNERYAFERIRSLCQEFLELTEDCEFDDFTGEED